MTLNEYCTGIADAIREKEGSMGAIPAPDHAARIKAITTGVDTSADTVVADALTEGYTAHDAEGNLVNGANPYEKTATNNAVNAQAGLIAQIQSALEGKAGNPFVVSVTLKTDDWGITAYFDENGTPVHVTSAGERTVNALYGIVLASHGWPPVATGDYEELVGLNNNHKVFMFKSNGGVVDNVD